MKDFDFERLVLLILFSNESSIIITSLVMTVTTIVIINAYFDLNITFITTNDISVRPSIEIYNHMRVNMLL